MNFRKNIRLLITVLFVTFCISPLSAFATDGATKWEKLENNRAGLMSIAYRGNTALFPENSLEAILSAKEIGVDMVSVNVETTKDDVLVLCENENLQNVCNSEYTSLDEVTFEELKSCRLYDNGGVLTDCRPVSLKEALEGTDDSIILVLDINKEDKDIVFDEVLFSSAAERVLLRFEENSKDIAKWAESKEVVPNVIGIYDGGIIWNTVSHIKRLSAFSSAVQYQSKNYFNVMYYENVVTKNYSDKEMARAIAPMYDADLCGQRSDSVEGWSDLISKGFSIIETNNPVSLVKYIERTEELTKELSLLIERAEKVDLSLYSDVSAANLKDAAEDAKASIEKGIASLSELESSHSALILSMNRLNLSDGQETQKGALNITTGKVVAVILVGAALLAGEIYVHKMQREKRRKD